MAKGESSGPFDSAPFTLIGGTGVGRRFAQGDKGEATASKMPMEGCQDSTEAVAWGDNWILSQDAFVNCPYSHLIRLEKWRYTSPAPQGVSGGRSLKISN
jgi:hypothetical protein